uniref:30S ribosomal protein S15 n=1 Tax=Tetraselmis sp. GSL018 TaxID=582737 RepID=A0A061S674_9CHLO
MFALISSPNVSAAVSSRPSYLQGTAILSSQARLPSAAPRTACLSVSARYRGKGTDLSKVASFQKSPNDTGSTAVQIARISARVEQLTAHLKIHKKDYSTQRGLQMLLGQRKSLLKYLYSQNKEEYLRVVSELKIRDKLSMVI